eukprot:TRINITY_DN11564_c0_g2_i1.p1 TRINITY_DN11564_c0_g2~~TRINITY_DN11564_c0_g2_i1.p1  ORF type:complete len:137 (+),score=3.33 TRINITY_DN11564_c0_g2_i1:544-954(+)
MHSNLFEFGSVLRLWGFAVVAPDCGVVLTLYARERAPKWERDSENFGAGRCRGVTVEMRDAVETCGFYGLRCLCLSGPSSVFCCGMPTVLRHPLLCGSSSLLRILIVAQDVVRLFPLPTLSLIALLLSLSFLSAAR